MTVDSLVESLSLTKPIGTVLTYTNWIQWFLLKPTKFQHPNLITGITPSPFNVKVMITFYNIANLYLYCGLLQLLIYIHCMFVK